MRQVAGDEGVLEVGGLLALSEPLPIALAPGEKRQLTFHGRGAGVLYAGKTLTVTWTDVSGRERQASFSGAND